MVAYFLPWTARLRRLMVPSPTSRLRKTPWTAPVLPSGGFASSSPVTRSSAAAGGGPAGTPAILGSVGPTRLAGWAESVRISSAGTADVRRAAVPPALGPNDGEARGGGVKAAWGEGLSPTEPVDASTTAGAVVVVEGAPVGASHAWNAHADGLPAAAAADAIDEVETDDANDEMDVGNELASAV